MRAQVGAYLRIIFKKYYFLKEIQCKLILSYTETVKKRS